MKVVPKLALNRGRTLKWKPFEKNSYLAHPDRYTPYGEDDVSYVYNAHGFRCDELEVKSDFPIIFLGCSFTEGTGLPPEHTWAYRLLERIRSKTVLTIPYWNLGVGGCSVDFVAEVVYWYSKNFAYKPRFIFSLFPDLQRRLASYQNAIPTHWNPALDRKVASPEEVTVMVDDRYAKFQTSRSLKIIDQTAALWGSKIVASSVSNFGWDLFEDFPHFTMVQLPPKTEHKSLARDKAHWGPEYHEAIAKNFWKVVEPLL